MASIDRRPDGRYRARWREYPGAPQRTKHFDRKIDATRFLTEIEHAKLSGAYVDPAAGRMPLRVWAARWQAAQLHHRATTAARADTNLRVHILPVLGDRPIGAITKADVQGLVQSLVAEGRLASTTIHSIYNTLAMVLKAAVEDLKIARTPCRKINLPEVVTEPVRIPTLDELEAVATLLPANYRRAVPVVAGTGLRLGEVLGLTVDRVDWLRRTVTVDRQMQTYPDGRVEHAPVKRPASNRIIPVGDVTLHTLNAQLAEFPTAPDGLIFRTSTGGPVRRGRWGDAWGKARAAAKIDTGQFDESGMPVLALVHQALTLHDARHFYASLLIRHGLSVKVVQARLGHASAVETLDTYGHLWPDDEDRTRAAVEAVLGAHSGGGALAS